jgi:AcrR family transcriptional regulator
MPRHKESEREQVRDATQKLLLDAAAMEFAREGYMGANINNISKAAGFAKGTVYNYFASKSALMLAVIDGAARAHFEFIRDRVLHEQDPRLRLNRFFEAGFDYVTTHLDQARVMINTLYGPDAEFKTQMYAAYQPMFRLVSRDIVVPGIKQGYFREVDPDAMALLLMTIYLGTGSQVSEEGRVWLDPGQVAEFVLHALYRKGSIGIRGG